MKFFVILEILLVAARVTVIFFPATPAEAVTALIWGCVVVGIIAAAFVGVELYNKIKGKKDK